MHRAAPRHENRLLWAVAILVVASVVPTHPAAAKKAQIDIPVVLTLLGVTGEMASLDQLVTRRLVTDFVAGDPVVEPVETGFQLDFTPTLPGGGQVGVTLDLSIAFLARPIEKASLDTPLGTRTVQVAELKSYLVSSSFQVADGDTIALDPVPAGPPILVTPRIVVPESGSPSMVVIEVRVPFGGHEIQLEKLRLLKQPRVTGVPARQNSIRYLTRRTFVTDVALGDPVTAQVESGFELDAMTDVADEAVAMDLGVRCRILDEKAPVHPVPTPNGKQRLQLPVLRTLDVQTSVDTMDGDSLAIAGVRALETEAVVIVTTRVLQDDGLQNVLVEARVVLVGGDSGEPKGKQVRSTSIKDFELTSWEGRTMALAQTKRRDVVTGFLDGEPVTAPLETAARLRFTPTLLGGDDADLEIALDYGHLDPAVAQFHVKTSGGSGPIDLPTIHLLQLDTAVAVPSGDTVAVGGVLREAVHAGRGMRDEALVFVTPRLNAGGDPDAVALSARVVHASEGDGPMTSSVEGVESGPVVAP